MVRRYRFLEAEHGRRVESNIGLGGAIGTCASASDSSEPESMSGSGTQSEPLSARVRSRSRPPMAILGISANSDLVAQSMATDAGMNAFVSKPFTLADLASAVALVLSKSL